jgi:hypothetical protein
MPSAGRNLMKKQTGLGNRGPSQRRPSERSRIGRVARFTRSSGAACERIRFGFAAIELANDIGANRPRRDLRGFRLLAFAVGLLVVALALFALAFTAIALVFVCLYMLHRGWAVAVAIADSRHPVLVAARQGIYNVADLARRPFRRPGSAAAR